MIDRLRAHRLLVVFAAGYYAVLLGVGFATGASQAPYYAVLMPVLFGLVAWIDGRVWFSTPVLWGLAVWGLVHMAGGLVPVRGDDRVLYGLWLLPVLRFDQVVHAFGFGVAGLAVWEGVRPRYDTSATSGALIVVIGGVGIGALNEMVEFLFSRVVSETNIGDFENTGWDLVANLVGAAAAGWWVRRRWRVGPGAGSLRTPRRSREADPSRT